MIRDSEKWYYVAVKSPSKFIQGITSNNDGDYYRMNCVHPFEIENKLKSRENVCKDNDYCNMIMPEEDSNNVLNKLSGRKIYEDSICYLCRHRIAT